MVHQTGPSPDLNGDGKVSIADLSWLASHYGDRSATAGWDAHLDLVPDGRIDLMDLVWLARRIMD